MLIIICPEIEDKQKGEQTKVRRKFKWKKEKVFVLETNKSRKQIETFEKGFNNTFYFKKILKYIIIVESTLQT